MATDDNDGHSRNIGLVPTYILQTYCESLLVEIYVLRKVGIGAIPEWHLRKVGILTLSADSRIIPDNSRIVQGK